ncbi:MAG TPA: polysaccharide biosynthesis C-terminal domain-containing protein [Longimicrobiales bacterium]|nr:polysaccharide biosynthesis C-terminal domain-containing protein [Longimicrobiales bacterium]
MRVGRSALGVFASNLFNVVLSFGNSILLTRTLGVVGRGEFAIFSASFGILSLLMGLGLDVSLRYFVAKEEVPRERILSTLMLFAGLSGILLLAVVHANHALFQNEIFLPSTRQDVRFELTLVGVVVANMIYGNIASVFAGSRSFKTLNVASVGFSAVSLALYGALLWAKASGRWPVDSGDVFVAYLGLQFFNAMVLVALAYRQLGVRPSLGLLDAGLLRGMLGYAGLAYVANLAQFLNYRVDIWIVQHFTGSAALGLYALAANLAMMLWLLPRATSTVLLPAMAAGEAGAGFREAARLGRISLAVTVAGAVPLALSAPWWITLLYGVDFFGAAAPFVILLLGCVPFTLCVIHAGALAGADRQGVNLRASTVGLAFTVALDFLLIPRYGIGGAAVASTVSYLVTTVIVLRAFAEAGSVSVAACLVPQPGDFRYVRDGLKSLLR